MALKAAADVNQVAANVNLGVKTEGHHGREKVCGRQTFDKEYGLI